MQNEEWGMGLAPQSVPQSAFFILHYPIRTGSLYQEGMLTRFAEIQPGMRVPK